MNLTEMIARVRQDLQDEDAANYRWTNDQIDGQIERVVREFSLFLPLEQQTDLATIDGSHDIDISGLIKRLKIFSLEFPLDFHPRAFQKFELYMDTLTMEDEGDGQDARIRWGRQHVLGAAWQASISYSLGTFVWPTTFNGYKYECTAAGISGATEPTWPTTLGQTVTDGTVTWTCHSPETAVTYSTIPEEHEEVIVLGATGYLATSASVYTVDRATIAGRHATINYRAWGKERLDRYEKQLNSLRRKKVGVSDLTLEKSI
ncbi:hypothetical protein ES706_06755 [subsurface metagenome]